MESGNTMSKNDKNPQGFWFYGPKKEEGVTEGMIVDFLYRKFNVLNNRGWVFYYDSECIYFVRPQSSYLDWTRSSYLDFKEIKESLPHYDVIDEIKAELCGESLEEENDDPAVPILITPGITKCDETCIFYQFCDGERESIYNPSYNSKTFPCTKYKLNRYDIKKTK
jgi:hypothetical protein